MYKKFKKIMAVILCLLIIVNVIISDNIQAKAVAPAVGGLSALKAIVGSGIAYAGYNATKKQVENITSTTSSLVGDYIVVAEKATSEDLTNQYTYDAFIASQWVQHPYKSALKTFAHDIYDKVAEEAHESWLKEHGETKEDDEYMAKLKLAWLKEHAEELEGLVTEDSLEEPTTEEPTTENSDNNSKTPKCSPWIGYGVGAGAGLQVSLSLGLNKIMSNLVSGIIKKDYNAEYEKTKSKYDWKSLNFKCDYDIFKTVDSSYLGNYMSVDSMSAVTSQISDKKTALVYDFEDNVYGKLSQVMVFNKIESDSQYGENENIAFVTLRDYKSENWNTYFTSERNLWQSFSLLKEGNIDFESFKSNLEPNLSIPNEPYIQKYQSYHMGDLFSSPYNFNLYSFNKIGSDSLFTINDNYGNGFGYGCSQPLVGSAYCINPSKTMNYFCINFSDSLNYIATCSTENGNVKPVVSPSSYTNFADEVNKASDITLDTGVQYDNTDEQARDIATDNDLDLKTVENSTEETADNTKGIWESVKSLPRKIYGYFNGILNKILSAIKALPLQTLNRFLNPLSGITDTLNLILEKMGINISIPDLSNIPSSLLRIIELNENIDLTLGNVLSTLQRNIAYSYTTALDAIQSAVEGIKTATESIGDINLTDVVVSPIQNTLTELFVPDMEVLGDAIDDLKSNFDFVDDFRGIAAKVMALNITKHDYITIYNWNKEGNKYDKRDSYRISFSWYEPYRKYVDAIIIAFVYFIFAWRIFIKLPGIINGTAGGIATAYGLDDYMQTENEKKQEKG